MPKLVERLTENTSLAPVAGCTGLFDCCGDGDFVSLTFEKAQPFLDWIGWTTTNVCRSVRNYITFVRPEYSGANPTVGYQADPCAPANSVEWGTCAFEIDDFGRLRRAAPVRDATKNNMNYCEAQPRFRRDGSQITDEREWNAVIATEALLQDLKRMIITGNASTGGQFDGFEQLVVDNYTDYRGRRCETMDSIVLDWNGNDMDGGAGITWNGVAVGASYDIIDVLIAIYRQIRQRMRWSPPLAAQNINVGDMILVMPDPLTQCLLDKYTCFTVCDGRQYNETNLNTLEARTFRERLEGGFFGYGRIFLRGFEIPVLSYDWELMKGPGGTLGDVYMLVNQVGNIKTLMGELNDMSAARTGYPEATFFASDGDRLLGWIEQDETCIKQTHEIQPRIVNWAPFLQTRIQNVRCNQPSQYISPDPTSSFFPESSFAPMIPDPAVGI